MFRRLLPPGLFLFTLIFLALSGCNTDDPVEPDPPPAGPAPVLASEPAFSPGLQNTVSWSFADDDLKGTVDLEFLVQRSGDPLFEDEVAQSGWIGGYSFEFAGLEHGSTNHYRVRGRNAQGSETEWSEVQVSTQDAVPPVDATMTELKEEQTSLLFTFELSADDESSGVGEIELWFNLEGEPASLFGTFEPGVVSFQAAVGGVHEFIPVAIDVAGNRQDPDATTTFATLVPEPIIIIDRNGEEFDITAAVLEFGMAEEQFEFGIGRYSILPVIDPDMISPGEFGYPGPNNTVEVLGVNYGGDNRAYKIGDMNSREVVDDVVNGIPIAVCY